MADRKQAKDVFAVLFLCILWYVVSSTNNVIGKMLLNDFPYPVTVTMVQLTSITLYSGPFFNMWGVRKFVDISWGYYMKVIVPLALGKFLASVSSHISIWKVPVSYAHTGKRTSSDRSEISSGMCSYTVCNRCESILACTQQSHTCIYKYICVPLFSVKATMPLFTVILSRIILQEKQTLTVSTSCVH